VIRLTSREARAVRGVFRRAALGIPPRGTIPPLVLRTDGTKLRAQHRYAGLAVEHVQDAPGLAPEAVALPLDTLGELEVREVTPVELEAVAPDRTVARWADSGIPQTREYEVILVDRLAPFPDLPAEWSDAPPGLLDTLAEASAIACHGSTRYALGCVQIRRRDGRHELVATDGCQLLVQGGFTLPWDGDVLVNRTPLFGSRVLREHSLSVGRTETHVVLRAGAWTLALEVRVGDRFPDVDRALPAEGRPCTQLALDPDDAEFLGAALDRLPRGDEPNAPVTVDLNGRIAVRARGAGGVRELGLNRSGYAGPPVRVQLNRRFLGRAVRLGFRVLGLGASPTPWSAATPSASMPGSRSRTSRQFRRPRTRRGSTPSRRLRAGRTGRIPSRTKGAR
jgi:hypothetical protein